MDGSKLDDILAHYGIKGMKWGVRKKRSDSSQSSSDAARASASAEIIKTSGVKALSNKDLKDLVTRMNLEQQYSTLKAQNKKTNPAVKFVSELLIGIGKQQAQRLAGDLVAKQIAKAIARS